MIVPTLSFAATALKTDEEKLSYTLGTQVGKLLQQQKVSYSMKALYAGLEDSLSGKKLRLTASQMKTSLDSLRKVQENKKKSESQSNLKKGVAFLSRNAKKKGVTSLATGVQYKVLKKGDGKTHPTVNSTVEVHYEGKLINGTVFDSSYKRGKTISFPLKGVIKGWTTTIPKMTKGATWILYIPASMAYGERGAGASIGPNETLIFKVELINIK